MYTFNESYFDIIDNADKAYLLGFICTDGCLYKREGHQGQLSISVKDCDISIIEHFKSSLQSNHPTKSQIDARRKTTTMATVVFVSDYLFNSLVKLGLNTQKTYTIDYTEILQSIPSEFWPAFYLGLFDGDGNIDYPKDGTISRGHVRLSGPIKQLQQLQNNLPFGEFCSLIVDKRNYTEPFGSLEAKGSIGKYCVLKYIYSNSVISLERKKNNALVLLNRIENNVTNRSENIKAVKYWNNFNQEIDNE